MQNLPLNKASLVGNELKYLGEAAEAGLFSGPGSFTSRCERMIGAQLGGSAVLLTPSCSSALEVASLACRIREGDEVILPSFTHPGTANAFLLHGARPVFVDINPDTCNLDSSLIKEAITNRTRAVVPVHYAGIACALDRIMDTASRHDLCLIEDAAHSFGASYRGRPLGTFGDYGVFSFHGSKNLSCGEGGALVVKDAALLPTVEVLRESGTDRQRYLRGEAKAYDWKRLGTAGLMPELVAAFLLGQLEQSQAVMRARVTAFEKYYAGLEPLVSSGDLRLPVIPADCTPNGHIFYGLCKQPEARDRLLTFLQERDIGAAFHYVPLHLSPQGRAYGYRQGQLPQTESVADSLFRLPLFFGIADEQIARVITEVGAFFGKKLAP